MRAEPGPPADPRIRAAYAHCQGIAWRHYENFPVASHVLPGHLRAPVAAIYAFARTADDYADEGARPAAERLALLERHGAALDAVERGDVPDDLVFIALADLRARHALPFEPLRDLLRAFTQDVTCLRYDTFDDVLAYCRLSANPVGRLLLHLFGHDGPADIACSDEVCSSLQLVNFLQDLEQDYRENGRIYLPLDEMERCGVTEEHFAARRTDEAMRALIRLQAGRATRMMERGAPLAWRLPGRAGFELRMIVFAARRVLDQIASEHTDVFRRPRLRRTDWPRILWLAATSRPPGPRT